MLVFEINKNFIKCVITAGKVRRMIHAIEVISTAHLNDEQISSQLLGLMKKYRGAIGSSPATVLIPRSDIILRHLRLPAQHPDEIRSMVELQVANDIPFAREEVELDIQVLAQRGDGYSDVAVAVLHREAALRYYRLFEAAHIAVARMTITSVGLWLLYRHQAQAPSLMGAIIDVDQDHSEICLCYKDYWVNSREIPVGLEQISSGGSDDFIKQWKITQVNILKDQSVSSLHTLFIVAPDGFDQSVMEALRRESGGAVKVLDVLEGLPAGKKIIWPGQMVEGSISLAAVLGVALASEEPPIDLVPQAIRQQKAQRLQRREMIACGIWGLVLLTLVGFNFGMATLKKNVELANLVNKVKEAQAQAQGVAKDIKAIEQIQDVLNNRTIFSALVEDLYMLMPKPITLLNVSLLGGNVLSLQGIASKASDINQLQEAMVSSAKFANVNLEFVNKRITQDGEINYFKLTAALKDQPKGQGNEH